MSITQELREHLESFPLDAMDVLRAVVAVHGLAETLALVGELFGDAGREYPQPAARELMEAIR